MSTVELCRVCLSRNNRMRIIASNSHLQTTFEKLSGTRLIANDGKPKTLCYICFAQLQKCWKFREMSRKASKLLSKLFNNGIESAIEKISTLDGKIPHTLSICTINKFTSISEHVKNENSEVCVKEEVIGCEETVEDRIKDDPVAEMPVQINENMETNSLKQESISLEPIECMMDNITCYEQSNIEARDYTTETSLDTHSSATRVTTYACTTCSKAFKQLVNLQRHRKCHATPKTHAYFKCFDTFENQIDLRKQIIMNTKVREQLHTCDLCGKTYISKYSLKVHITLKHMRMVTGKKTYKCDSCNKTFNHRGTLRLHMRIHTGDKPYACDKCAKTFSQKGTLQRHTRMHTGEKPYACHECTKTFNQESSLKRHIKMHNGVKPYACNRCEKTYYESSHLTRHIRTHTGEKPYACNRCSQTFSQSSNLKAHMKKHTGNTASNYICHECNKTFDHKSIFKRHVLKHTREKPFPCDLCDKKYADKRTLQRHLVTHNQNSAAVS